MSNLVKGGNVPQSSRQAVAVTIAVPPRRTFFDILEDLGDIASMAAPILIGVAVIGIILGTFIWGFISINSSTTRIDQQNALHSEVTDSVSNIKHALNNERSVAYVQARENDYLATITDKGTQVKIAPASCKAQRGATTYSVVGTIPSQHAYLVYNSVTGKYLSGSYTKASLIPDLTC